MHVEAPADIGNGRQAGVSAIRTRGAELRSRRSQQGQGGKMNSSERVGTVQALWRFPVKSMLGEQVGVVEVGKGGIVGDRAYAV